MAELRRTKRDLPGFKRDEVEGFFCLEDGFHQVDWQGVFAWIGRNFDRVDERDATRLVVEQWLELIRGDLGGDYHLVESGDIVLLSDRRMEAARWLARYAERALATIHRTLGSAAWEHLHPLILFSEEDDYYTYIARFCPDGEQARSGGVFIREGYPHIVVLSRNANDAANGIVHELTHHSLDHFHLPLWVNEGVAMLLQRQIAPPDYTLSGDQEAVWSALSSWAPPLLWDELAERHFDFWNEANIQSFWAGTSFYTPGDANELSYNLAEVLLNLLCEGKETAAFTAFLQSARWEDAGQDAAQTILHRPLGDVAATFLGSGNWGPNRQRLAECWLEAGWNEKAPE